LSEADLAVDILNQKRKIEITYIHELMTKVIALNLTDPTTVMLCIAAFHYLATVLGRQVSR